MTAAPRKPCYACGAHKLSGLEFSVLKRRLAGEHRGENGFVGIGRTLGMSDSRVRDAFTRALNKIEKGFTNHIVDPIPEEIDL